MKLTVLQLISRYVVVLAMILQATAPVSAAAGRSDHIDIGQIFCSPSGELSDSAKTAAERLLKILNETPGEEDENHSGHCSLCTLSAAAVLPDHVWRTDSLNYAFTRDVPRYEPGLIHRPHGPPLGSRSPPTLI